MKNKVSYYLVGLLTFLFISNKAHAQYSFKMQHEWSQCLNCKQESSHSYSIDEETISNIKLKSYARVYCYRKNAGSYLFVKDADQECSAATNGKHNWKSKSEILTINVSEKNLQDLEKERKESESATNKKNCEQSYYHAQDYRIGLVNTAIVRLCAFLEYSFDESSAIGAFHWDDIKPTAIEDLIFTKKVTGGGNKNLTPFLVRNDFGKIVTLCDLIWNDKIKIEMPITDGELKYYREEYNKDVDNCNLQDAIVTYSINPKTLKTQKAYKSPDGKLYGEDLFALENNNYENILKLAYARALEKLGRKKEAFDIYKQTDLTQILTSRPFEMRSHEYNFANTDNPGVTKSFSNEADKSDKSFCEASIISYLKLCRELKETPIFKGDLYVIKKETNWITFATYCAPFPSLFKDASNTFWDEHDRVTPTPEGTQNFIIKNLILLMGLKVPHRLVTLEIICIIWRAFIH